jgi:hypothetical protein
MAVKTITVQSTSRTALLDYTMEAIETGDKATGTITSNGTDVTADDTVTINGKVYKFVATPTVEGDVDIGGTAAITLDNLKAAINHTGTEGTDYVCAAAHPTVTATTNTDTVQTLEAITAGTAGNALTLVKSAATLTVSGAVLAGGANFGMQFTNTGREFLVVKNIDAVNTVVTAEGQTACEVGTIHDAGPITVANGKTVIFGPFSQSYYNDANNLVQLTVTGTEASGGTIAVIKLAS